MTELIDQLISEIRSAARFRWHGIAVAWLIALFGWLYVAQLPHVYEASARVYVDTSSVLAPILRDQIVAPDVDAELAYVRESLLGVERLSAVAADLGLDAQVRDARDREALLRRLREDIQIATERPRNSGARNSVYSITYRNENREGAVAVVEALLDALIEDAHGVRLTGSDTAGRFLAARIQEYEARLQSAEQALADFKRENADRLPGSEGDYFTRLRTQREALQSANQELALLQAKRAQLADRLRGGAANARDPASGEELPQNSTEARIREYEGRLETLLLQYTERHPDVIALRETLDRLKVQREQELASLDAGDPASVVSSSPVYQALQISLNQVDVDIATLQTDIAAKTERVQALQRLINEVPEVEAELARLNRDYTVVYDQYVALVRSRETQELTNRATETDRVDFRVINPPSAPLAPVAPQRLLLLAGVFVAALAAGGALCYLLAQLRPVFSSVRLLRDQLGLPVLGTVSQAWQERQAAERKRKAIAFAAPLLGFVFAFFVLVAVEGVGPGLHTLYEQAVR